jgi:hypothetical protein
VDTNVHLMVARINYDANAADTLTAWLDPNTSGNENSQNSSSTYTGSVSGDFSFDRFFLCGGYSGKQFDYGDICMGTSWSAVVPSPAEPGIPAPAIERVGLSPGNQFNFSFCGSAGQSYSILASTNLTLPPDDWTAVHTGTFGFNTVSLNWKIPLDDPRHFFRISIP